MPVVIGGIDTTDTAELGQVTVSAGFDVDHGAVGTAAGAGGGNGLNIEAAAIGVRVRGCLLSSVDGNSAWTLLKELRVYGTAQRTALVSITDDYPPVSSDVYFAPAAAAILNDANFGEPAVLKLDGGNITETEARAIAQLAIKRMLLLFQKRIYGVNEFDVIPQLGQTVRIDDFTGVCWECDPKWEPAGGRSMRVTLVNLNQTYL